MTIMMTMTMVTIITIHHLMMITDYGQLIEDGRLKRSRDTLNLPPQIVTPKMITRSMTMVLVELVCNSTTISITIITIITSTHLGNITTTTVT